MDDYSSSGIADGARLHPQEQQAELGTPWYDSRGLPHVGGSGDDADVSMLRHDGAARYEGPGELSGVDSTKNNH